jgi:hypothetical protein
MNLIKSGTIIDLSLTLAESCQGHGGTHAICS